MGRFRVRLGETEIEYEGEDSEQKYAEALAWIGGKGEAAPARKHSAAKESASEEAGSKAGGPRSPVIGPKVDELISEDWFSKHRKIPEIMTELKNRGVPGVNVMNVRAACMRRVRSKKLKTIMDGEERVFWSASVQGNKHQAT